ncbi:MAG TPA: hypothetical protein VG722_13395 [Tepidisphaeraceae bacterium]|jgi:hypothetical protein|nr:hypothetical protein [Tepidisphaeraceae bacterium]
MSKRSLLAGTVLVAGMLGGCMSTFDEVHYFKAEDRQTKQTVNYYRLHIYGGAFLSSARYMSGYYSPTAVEQYFGEFSQPANGQFPEDSSGSQAASSSTTITSKSTTTQPGGSTEVTTLSGNISLDKRMLVLLFSTNSDAIASQISTVATSQDITSNLLNLVSAKQINAGAAAQASAAVTQGKNHALAVLGDSLGMAGSPDLSAGTRDAVLANLLAYANALAADLGNDEPFTDFTAAAKWLQAHRATLEKE